MAHAFLQSIRLKMFMKEPHTALFNFIVIICPTLAHNSTYRSRGWVWNDPDVIPIKPGNNFYDLIEKISNLLAESKTLFLIDDNNINETLLMKLSISAINLYWNWLYQGAIDSILYGC